MFPMMSKSQISPFLHRLLSELETYLASFTSTQLLEAQKSMPQSEDRLLARTLTDMRAILQPPDSALQRRSAKLSLAREYLSTNVFKKEPGSIYRLRRQ